MSKQRCALSLNAVHEHNPFEILGLNLLFDLDILDLEKRFLEAQKTWHPDLFLEASSLFAKVAEKRFSHITNAYKILKNPLKRAEAILRLKDHWPIPQNPAVLETMMELREEKEMNPDSAHTKLEQLKKQSLDDLGQFAAKQQWKKMGEVYLYFSFSTRLLEERGENGNSD